MTATNVSGTVASDFTLLDVVQGLQDLDGAGVTELATHLGLAKSSVHKHLKSLEQREFVVNNDGAYSLSLKFLEYGGFVRDGNRIYRYARRKAARLAEQTGEMILVSVREYDHGVILFRTNDRYGLQNLVPLGERILLHQNAAGRAMLAEFSDEEIDRFVQQTDLPPAMEKTITDPDQLVAEVEQIRERGYAVSRGERFEGIRAVSAAIEDEERGALGAISVVVPDEIAIADELEAEYAEAIAIAARDVSLELKYEDHGDGVSS